METTTSVKSYDYCLTRFFPGGGGGGWILPYMGYIGMCARWGMVFEVLDP